jgi:excisionase family DNA binding protein
MSALLSPEQAAERLHVSERTLRDMKRRGVIRYVAITARKIAYREDDLEEFVDSHTRQDEPVRTAPVVKSKPRKGGGVVIPFSQLVGSR